MDNSGVREVRMIQALKGGMKRGEGQVGDRVVGSVKRLHVDRVFGSVGKVKEKEWKRGSRVNGVRVMTKKEIRRKDGSWVRRGVNGMVRRNKKGETVANRVLGVRPTEIRSKGYAKRLSMSSYVV